MLETEENLLEAAWAGNKQAFGLIVEKYQSLICAVTYNATGDIGLSEDIAQETFLTAWRKLQELGDATKLRAWLCGIARNISRDVMRRMKSKNRLQSLSLKSNDVPEMGAIFQAEKHAISKEEQKILWQSLEKIPDLYREPLILFYREQQSVAQVAEGLELSEDVVKQRLSRGRKLLKREIATFVEDILGRTGPKKIFTIAVIAALPAAAPQAASAAIMATASKSSALTKFAGLISLIGGILAPLLALIGIIVAIKPEIKNMSQRERKELLRVYRILFPVFIIFTVFIISFNLWWCKYVAHSGWILFMISCVLLTIFLLAQIPFMIRSCRRYKQIQIEEGTYVKPELQALNITNGQIYGAFGGAIFASLLWLIRICSAAKDWMVLGIILTFAILIFTTATKLCIKARQHGFRVAIGVFTAIGFLHLLLVNLRWEKWQAVLKHPHLTHGQINMVIVAVVASLVLVALVHDLWLRKKTKNNNRFP